MFEYKVVGVPRALDTKNDTNILNDYAALGWRLFNISWVEMGVCQYTFERQANSELPADPSSENKTAR